VKRPALSASLFTAFFPWLLSAAWMPDEKGASAAAEQRPNLLLLVTDDQPFDALSCAGHSILRTPHMDALARSGVRFTHAFATTPICAASRASLFTGRYERAHGYTFTQPPLSDQTVRETYPSILRRAGYRVGFVGKLGVSIGGAGREEMFDEFTAGTYPYLPQVPTGQGERHLTELNTERFLIHEIVHGAEDDNPDQYVWPASCDALYEEDTIPPPRTADPAFFEALPEFLRTGLNRERWHWRFDTPEKRQRMVKGYYRMLSGVDEGIGRLLATLDELGLQENTVILFIGDNGYFLGERGYAGKWTMHERSTRVPLIVCDPRLQEDADGRVLDAFALNIDIAPTLLDLAGVELPSGMQGRSLRPLLEGTGTTWREEVFTEHLWKFDRIPRTEALRTRDWKYIRYLDHPEYEELYDLVNDPDEEHNLAREEQHAEQRVLLAERCSLAAERAQK